MNDAAELADYYAELGVDPAASAAEIRSAYRRSALARHPDHAGNAGETARGEAERAMARLNAAYEVLSDEQARIAYDAARIAYSKRQAKQSLSAKLHDAIERGDLERATSVARDLHACLPDDPDIAREYCEVALAFVRQLAELGEFVRAQELLVSVIVAAPQESIRRQASGDLDLIERAVASGGTGTPRSSREPAPAVVAAEANALGPLPARSARHENARVVVIAAWAMFLLAVAARPWIERTIASSPSGITEATRESGRRLEAGRAAFDSHDYTSAIGELERSVELSPNNDEAQQLLERAKQRLAEAGPKPVAGSANSAGALPSGDSGSSAPDIPVPPTVPVAARPSTPPKSVTEIEGVPAAAAPNVAITPPSGAESQGGRLPSVSGSDVVGLQTGVQAGSRQEKVRDQGQPPQTAARDSETGSRARGGAAAPAKTSGDARGTSRKLLSVGDQAPAISAVKWVNGEAPGRNRSEIQVVVFWALPPGRSDMSWVDPRLSSLQENFARRGVSVVVVTQGEPDAVERHVHARSGRIKYAVAIDDRGQTFAAWFEAAGLRGIPSAFLVDRDNRIAFIGNPYGSELDVALQQVLAARRQ